MSLHAVEVVGADARIDPIAGLNHLVDKIVEEYGWPSFTRTDCAQAPYGGFPEGIAERTGVAPEMPEAEGAILSDKDGYYYGSRHKILNATRAEMTLADGCSRRVLRQFVLHVAAGDTQTISAGDEAAARFERLIRERTGFLPVRAIRTRQDDRQEYWFSSYETLQGRQYAMGVRRSAVNQIGGIVAYYLHSSSNPNTP